MIKATEAYKKLKAQIQDSIDFVYLNCHAVPSLKGYIKAVEKGSADKLPDADHFTESSNHDRLRKIIPNYKKL